MTRFAALVILWAAFLWLLGRYRRQDEQRQQIWQDFARDHEWQWHGASGRSFRRQLGFADGEMGGVLMVLDEHLTGGQNAVQYTRLRATVHPPLGERVIVTRRNLLNRARFALKDQIIATGDVRLDALALVGCRSREYALQLLSEPVRVAWASFPKRAELVCEWTTATLMWPGIETDRSVLDAASELLLAVARATSKLTQDCAPDTLHRTVGRADGLSDS